MATAKKPAKELLVENEELRLRLEETEETLRAIGSGEVDAFVVSGLDGPQVFTLKGAEQPYRVLVETMNEGAATLAEDGTILYCNSRLAAMLQVPLESLIGTQIGSFVAPADRPLISARLVKCTKECDKDEITMITRVGNPVPAMVSCCALALAGSRQISMVVADLTQQKRNEEIVASERLARSIIEQAGEAIIVCDEEGRVIRVSRSAHQLCGVNSLLSPFDELFQLRIKETECLFSVLTPLAGGWFESVEVEFSRSDGEIFHLLLNATPLKGDQNRIIGCIVTLTDFTESKDAEEALQNSEARLQAAYHQLQIVNEELQAQSEELQAQSEELQVQSEELHAQNQELTRLWEVSQRAEDALKKLNEELENRIAERTAELTLANDYNRSLIEASVDPLVTIGYDGKITDVNNATEAVTGRSRGELIGTDFCDYFSEPDKARAGYEQVFREGSVRDYPLDLRNREGHLTSVIYNATVYRDDQGKVIGVFAAARDITEQKKAQVALKELNEELESRVIERTAQLNSANEKLRDSHRAALNLMEDAIIARKEAEEVSNKLRLEIAERKRAEEELRSSEEKLRLFIEHAPAGLAMFDREMRYIHASRRWRDDYKLGDKDLLGVSHYEIFPEMPQAWREAHRRGLAGEVLRAEADRFVRANGAVQWIRWEIRPWRDAEGNVGGIVIFAEDITDIKLAELELVRLNKAMKALSDSSQAVIRSNDEMDYLGSVCRIVVDVCGYSMAWIGFAENDEAKSVRPAAYSGFEEGYLETLKLTWADTERGRGPTGMAIRTGRVAMCRNMLTDPAFIPWREEAIRRGYASSIVLPLMMDGKAFGAISIYSPEADPFSENEVKLLSELADNVAYGIMVLRIRVARLVAEEALRERERSLAEIVRKSPSFVCILRGPDHVYEMANEKYLQLVGERNVLGKKLVDALPEIADSPYPKILDRVYQTGEPFSENNASITLARGPEGRLEEAWLDFIYLPLRESDGTISGIFVHGIDLTERKQAEESLRKSYQRLDLLYETAGRLLASDSPQLVVNEMCGKVMEFLDCHAFFNFLVDEKAGRLRLNACAGIPEEEAQRIEWLDYGSAVCGCAARDACRIVAEDIPNTPDPRTDLVKSYGILAYACHPLFAQGRVLGTLSFGTRSRPLFTDDELSLMKAVADQVAIAMERKRYEQELLLAREAAEAASRAKSQFLANMSHELRTPMTGVLGMLELALEGPLDERQQDFIGTAQKSARSLLRILNDILDLSRVEAGKMAMEERPFNLRDCVAGAIDIIIPAARRKGLDLICAVADDVPKTVTGDQTRLLQVLTNLCGNAIKFTEKGKVEVRVTSGGQRAEGKREITFTVADTGIGIPEAKRHLLFNSFSQVDDSNTRRYGGTGLGLAISREIVERMGGTITFESTEGAGSIFTFTVPFAGTGAVGETDQVTVAVKPVITTVAPADEERKIRLLLAEDDPITRQVIGLMLKRSNFVYDIAENGMRAVEMWEKERYDLILMDVQMPGMDGFTATGVIREKEQSAGGHTIIVAMTAHAFPEDEKRCLDAGMDAYIPKPIDLKQCMAMIEELIGARELKA